MYEDPDNFTSPARHNWTYNLWQLGQHRVLIRCGIHVYTMEEHRKVNGLFLSCKFTAG
jgi:hypothetical protein